MYVYKGKSFGNSSVNKRGVGRRVRCDN